MSDRIDVMIYVQHLLGIGHLRRAAQIAQATAAAGLETLLVSGGLPVKDLDLGKAEFLQLPPIRSADAAFSALVDERGQILDEAFKAERRDLLLAAFQQAGPRALVTEMFPFGRRMLRFELLPLVEAAWQAKPPPLLLASVRDVLNPVEQPEKRAWMSGMAAQYYDWILVHGDPALLPFEASFPDTASFAGKLIYTGFITGFSAAAPAARSVAGEVLVSAGGGAVAGPLVEACLAARPLTTLAERTWRLLLGHNFSQPDFESLQARAPQGVIVERARPDFPQLLQRCALSISQAGYNTTLEVLTAGVPAVVVPFAAGSEREQSLRACNLEARGWLAVVEEAGLTGPALAAGVEKAQGLPPHKGGEIDLDGAQRTAEFLHAALKKGGR